MMEEKRKVPKSLIQGDYNTSHSTDIFLNSLLIRITFPIMLTFQLEARNPIVFHVPLLLRVYDYH